MTTRAVLVVYPEAERRGRLRALLDGYEVLEASNRQEAVEVLTKSAPALVLTHLDIFPRLLKDLERYTPRSILAVLCPEDNAQAHHNLVDVAAAGHMFFTLEDDPSPALRRAVQELLDQRESGRREPHGVLDACFTADGTTFRARLQNVATGGLGLRLESSVRIERLTPGTELEGLQVLRGDTLVLRAGHATVRMVRPLRANEGHGFHLGVSLERPVEHSRSSAAPLLKDSVRIRGLLRRAVRAGVGFGLRTHEGNRLVDFSRAKVLTEESRLVLSEQSQPGTLFHPGDVVRLCLDFGGVCHVGTTAVLASEPNQVEVALPRALSLHHRRNSLRFRSSAERPFAVSFNSPLTGEPIVRPLLDLHTGGFAFPFVRPAETSDLRWLEQHLRETQDVVRLRSSDLVEGEMSLGTLGGRYADARLRRSRSIALVDGQDGPKGFVLMEDSTPGLFWAELYNAFSLVMVEQDAREADTVRQALVTHAVADSARRDRSTAECLAADADLPALEALGFHNLGKVMEFIAHRRLVRDWNAYLLAVFERLAAHGHGGGRSAA